MFAGAFLFPEWCLGSKIGAYVSAYLRSSTRQKAKGDDEFFFGHQ